MDLKINSPQISFLYIFLFLIFNNNVKFTVAPESTKSPSLQPSCPTSQPTQEPSQLPTIHIQSSLLRTGLIAVYAFDGNTNDGSGNGNHGIIKGKPAFL